MGNGYRRVSLSSEGIQRVEEKIDDSLHTATTMTLSPDGKWSKDTTKTVLPLFFEKRGAEIQVLVV